MMAKFDFFLAWIRLQNNFVALKFGGQRADMFKSNCSNIKYENAKKFLPAAQKKSKKISAKNYPCLPIFM